MASTENSSGTQEKNVPLLPCPFCGEHPITRREINEINEQFETLFSIRCYNNIVGCEIGPSTPKFKTREAAQACWERRMSDNHPSARAEIKPFEKLPPGRCVELCNTINNAIALEKIVMADNFRIVGAFPNHGTICCILHESWNSTHVPHIWLEGQTIRIAGENDVIYEPGPGYFSSSCTISPK
jgi:hypothetical protein